MYPWCSVLDPKLRRQLSGLASPLEVAWSYHRSEIITPHEQVESKVTGRPISRNRSYALSCWHGDGVTRRLVRLTRFARRLNPGERD